MGGICTNSAHYQKKRFELDEIKWVTCRFCFDATEVSVVVVRAQCRFALRKKKDDKSIFLRNKIIPERSEQQKMVSAVSH